MNSRVLPSQLGDSVLVPIWVAGSLGAFALGYLAVFSPELLAGWLVASAALIALWVSFSSPGTAVVGAILLLVTYVPDVAGDRLGLPVSTQALVLLTLVSIVAHRMIRREAVVVPKDVIGLVLLAAAMCLSTFFATDVPLSFTRIADFVKDALLVIVIAASLGSVVWLRRGMWAYAMGGSMLAALALAQQLTGGYGSAFWGLAVTLPYETLQRSAGPLDPNYFGQMLLVSFVMATYLAMTGTGMRARVAYALSAATCLGAIAFTLSRGTLVALFLTVTAIAILRRIPLLFSLPVAATLVLIVAVTLPAPVKDRISASVGITRGAEEVDDRAIRGRLSENVAAARMFVDHPLVGVGPGNFSVHYLEYSQSIGLDPRVQQRTPHNLYLEPLAEMGVVGALAFFWILCAAGRRAWRARGLLGGADSLLAEGIFVSLLGFLTTGVFLHAAYPRYLWITIGLALALGQCVDSNRRHGQ